MPTEETPVRLNASDFWAVNCVRSSVRASNSFRVTDTRSVLFTDKELSELLSSLPLSRQIHPFQQLEATKPPSAFPTCRSHVTVPSIRTSRSVELEIMQDEIYKMEQNVSGISNVLKKQRDTAIGQRNQLMKINEGLAKYISSNS